jgi:hypothetical protein
VSIGESWPDIDKLDKAGREGASAQSRRESLPPRPSSERLSRRVNEGTVLVTRRALVDDALGPLSAPLRGYGGGSARSKAARILSDTPKAILPHMQRSFMDRQYSPSIGMDRSEWEIILEELTRMVYIVKKEPLSEGDD